MTVTYRMIETAFERAARRPGGKRVSECLLEAHSNLEVLAPRTLPRFQEGLNRIRAIAGSGRDRPSDGDLKEILHIADGLTGYCLTVNRPGLDQVLLRTARLSDAVHASDLWIPGTFAPLIETFQLTLDGALDVTQVATLIESIDLCVSRYGRAERRPVPDPG